MGGGIAKLDSRYDKERSQLRRALILSFLNNPENTEIVDKIEALKVQ
jgi:hypothetical protein